MNGTIWDGWATPSCADPNSAAAADSMLGAAGSIRRDVAALIAQRGPLAEWQVAARLGISRPTATPRIYELHRAGVIARLTTKGTTPSGRRCYLYVITETGRRALAS